MRKNCETCKHDDAEYPFYPYKTPCDKCETRYGSNTPSEWKPADHYKPDTNADRIRAMSDEELAHLSTNALDAEYCTNDPVCADLLDSDDGIPEEKCIACALRWLRQPLKENDHA